MAIPKIIKEIDSLVYFRLSNKPDFECVVDSDVYEDLILSGSWYIKKFRQETFYITRTNKFKKTNGERGTETIFLHWEVLGVRYRWGDKRVVDHIDRNPLNNTRGNLRSVSISENNKNRNRPNKWNKEHLDDGFSIYHFIKSGRSERYRIYKPDGSVLCDRNTKEKALKQIEEYKNGKNVH